MEIKIRDKRRKGYFTTDNEAVDEMGKIIGGTAFLVYSIISRHSDKNEESFPSQDTIAEKAGIHRDTAIDKVKVLEAHNMIKVDQTKEAGTGKWLHNTYTLLDKTVWIKYLHGVHVDKTSTRVEADTVSTNSDTNKTNDLSRPIEKISNNLTPSQKRELKEKRRQATGLGNRFVSRDKKEGSSSYKDKKPMRGLDATDII